MRFPVTASLLAVCSALAHAQDQEEGEPGDVDQEPGGRTVYVSSDYAIANAPEDIANMLEAADQRSEQRESMLPVSPLGSFRDWFSKTKDNIYEKSSLRLGIASNNLYQVISTGFPGTDRWAVASDFDVFGTWELTNKGDPNQGQIAFHIEGRWDYGTPGPSILAVTSLGSLIRTADSFSAYSPTFLPFRNLYWQQGSADAGWTYRLGKITPDQILGTSRYLNPFTTFHPTGSVATSQPYSDSGIGTVGAWYFDDRSYVLGLVSDANADRQDWGDITEGDFYKAIEFGYKINPKTEEAGYWKLTIGHNDGTSDGLPSNAALGPSGWGFSFKAEQELSEDGRSVGILKYGHSTNDSALYVHLASAHYVLKDPPDFPFFPKLYNDLLGVGFTWAEPTVPGGREESVFEFIYRFPLFPQVDMTLGYQSVFNPVLNQAVDHASVFNLRLRATL